MAGSRFASGIGSTSFKIDAVRELLDGLYPTVHSTIPAPGDEDLADVASESVHPTNFETVSSYNWVYGPGKRLKIIVPGYPSCWNPPPAPMKLPSDIGFRFIHQNEYFSPGTPLRPLLRAVHTHRPDFNVKEVDFITDRNSLIRLFKFARGDSDTMMDIFTGSRTPSTPPTKTTTALPTPPTSPTSPTNPTSPTSPTSSRPPPNRGSWRDRHPPSYGGGLRGRASPRGRGRGDGRYIRGEWSPNYHFAPRVVQETRIDIDLVNNSLLLSRWETNSSEMVHVGEFRGWGYQFLDAYTRFGEAGEDAVMDGGELQSHHRVITYDFGGKKFLVRFHGDAVQESLGEFRWWAEKHRKGRKEQEAAAAKVGNVKEKDNNSQSSPRKKADDWLEKEFVEGLSKLTLNNINTTNAIESHPTVTPLYPHSSLVGIKTCSIKNKAVTMSRALPQAFFSQTPHLYIGYQHTGLFTHIDKIETEDPLREWEVENDAALRKLLVLLGRIKKVVEGIEGGQASVIFRLGGEMSVYARKDGSGPVPGDLRAKWD